MKKQAELVSEPRAMEIAEALQFLVTLANADVDELSKRPQDDPDGLSPMLFRLRRYFDTKGEDDLRRAIESAKTHPQELKAAIADVRRLLEVVVRGQLDKSQFTLTKPRKVKLVEREGMLQIQRDGNLHDTLIDTALDDLGETKVKLLRIGQCQRGGCTNFFYKLKLNQTYCTHQCANKAAAARRPRKPNQGPRPANR